MITLNLDWHEVLWWMQGGMAGSHIRWKVYEYMVNKVWPQCSEQDRRNLWFVMYRDFGDYWRPDGWHRLNHEDPHGEGPWKADDDKGYATDADGSRKQVIFDTTPWMFFRKVLARFDPENQYAVTIRVHNAEELDEVLRLTPAASIILRPSVPLTKKGYAGWYSSTATITVRAYQWQGEFRIDWGRRCAPDRIIEIKGLNIPDDGTM